MINPNNITNYNLTTAELEETLLFWVCAAGKNGTTAARLLDKFLTYMTDELWTSVEPFATLKQFSIDRLAQELRRHGIGCYNHKARTMYELVHANLNLKICTTDDLEKIYGIGMKTSRCFIIHSRENVQLAGLDTHMLKHLKLNGIENVPKATPSSKLIYKRLELEVLRLSKEANMNSADYDLKVWNNYAVK